MSFEDGWHSDVSTARRTVPCRMFCRGQYRTTPDELPYYAGCFGLDWHSSQAPKTADGSQDSMTAQASNRLAFKGFKRTV